MSQFTFEAAEAMSKNNGGNNSNNENRIGFFSLKNDGDNAVVRILLNDIHELEILSVHDVPIKEKNRKVNCLRGSGDPINNCPLCTETTIDTKSGNKTSKYPSRLRAYIKLISYAANEQGKIVGTPLVWERSYKYVVDLKSKLTTYGPLSGLLFMVTRHGKQGDTNTSYSIEYLPSTTGIYTDATYPPIPNAFEGYSALGRIVLDKTFEDVKAYTTTGNFPYKNDADAATPAAPAATFTAPTPQTQYNAPAASTFSAPAQPAAPAVNYAEDELPF